MYRPKIHVIIPVYNCENYLPQAVSSVLDQSYENIYVYLIDDGSTDNSSSLCDTLASNNDRIKVVHQTNGGVSSARNNGIDQIMALAADEDYIAFCDADDLWMKDAITSDIISENLCEKMITFGTVMANQDMTRFYILSSFENRVENDISKSLWLSGCFCATLYSCKMIRDHGMRFTLKTKYVEDWMFETACKYCAGSIRYSSKYLYVYRHNGSSAMHSTRRKTSKIDYFSQIINGWVETNELINSFSCVTGSTTSVGNTLASIYFLDMAAAHYKNWGSRRALEEAFVRNPNYHLFIDMAEKDVSPKQYKAHLLLKEHHTLFRLKYNLLGIFDFIVETAYKFPFVKQLYIRRKYYLTAIPKN